MTLFIRSCLAIYFFKKTRKNKVLNNSESNKTKNINSRTNIGIDIMKIGKTSLSFHYYDTFVSYLRTIRNHKLIFFS